MLLCLICRVMKIRQSRLDVSREQRGGNSVRKNFVDFTWRRRFRDNWRRWNNDNERLSSRASLWRRLSAVNLQVTDHLIVDDIVHIL